MRDQFGRTIDYLRLSVTERCNLRCTYCRAEEGDCPKTKELKADEFSYIVKVFAQLGIKKVRLTGGEPLLRKDILEIVRSISSIPGIEDLSMTTNAQQLGNGASQLKEAGLHRINFSMDSLRPERFKEICGGNLDLVLKAIEDSLRVGLSPVKINVVLVRGRNDDEVDDFMELTRYLPIDIRFIELMPLGVLGQQESLRVNNLDLIKARPYLKPLSPRYPNQPSRDYKIEGYMGRVGFISPHSQAFCQDCNRVRVLSDGKMRLCLGNKDEISLLDAFNKGDKYLREKIEQAIFYKPEKHHFENAFVMEKNMRRIGG